MLQQRGILNEVTLANSNETVVFCLGVYEMEGGYTERPANI